MRITEIRQLSVNLRGKLRNAVVDFSQHTVSLVALVSDVYRRGQPIIGIAFNSIGRFAQPGIIQDRLIPRILGAKTETLLSDDHRRFSPQAIARTAMLNEKPGGHGDRSSAVAAIELAAWDLNAKLAGEPAYAQIARTLNKPLPTGGTPVYAAGGYYYPAKSKTTLLDELLNYRDLGYNSFKIKIGGAPLHSDLQRVEMALRATQHPNTLAVDANGRFTREQANQYGSALQQFPLKWYEEPCDPLDYALLAEITRGYTGPIATGENLFSAIDTHNLTQFGGLRGQQDILQMDPGLAYGLTEYLQMLKVAEQAGFSPSQCIPHGGHLINLHIVTALGLGGCEAYPGVFQPFGGYAPQCRLEDGRIFPSDAVGFGLEQKPELKDFINQLTEV